MPAYDRKHQHSDRRHVEPTTRSVRAASVVLFALAAVLLGLTVGAAASAGLLDGFGLAGGLAMIDREEVCRCGHYRYLHLATRYACRRRHHATTSDPYGMNRDHVVSVLTSGCDCQRFRKARWTDEHSTLRYVSAWLWYHLPTKLAIWACDRLWPKADPCRLVECWMPDTYADRRRNWYCLCDAVVPWEVEPPRPGWCYCREVEAS